MAQPYAQAEKKFDLRNTALAANAAELPHLELNGKPFLFNGKPFP